MKIIVSRFAPKGYCVNLFNTIWTRDDSWIDKYVVNHERIHTAQQKELLFVFFYLAYGLEWLFRYLKCGNKFKAYRQMSFEMEAYANSSNLNYLDTRKHYAQWRKSSQRKDAQLQHCRKNEA